MKVQGQLGRWACQTNREESLAMARRRDESFEAKLEPQVAPLGAGAELVHMSHMGPFVTVELIY